MLMAGTYDKLRNKWDFCPHSVAVIDVIISKEPNQSAFFRSCPKIEKPPQNNCVCGERNGVLEDQLRAQSPIEETCVRRVSAPPIYPIRNEFVVLALSECNGMRKVGGSMHHCYGTKGLSGKHQNYANERHIWISFD
jgi:hypothetical protein